VRILITGASGFAGALILPALREEGHELRLYARDPGKLQPRGEEVFIGDLLTATNLRAALEGVEVAYYLVHSMERPRARTALDHRPFAERELIAAKRFADLAARAGVRRIVYLGGLLPPQGQPSRHLASRLEVERALLAAVPDSVALRSSIVIGPRSRSFRLLVRLIERLPVLPLPPWRDHRTQPLDGRDLQAILVRAKEPEVEGGRTYELGGPDTVTYRKLLELIAEVMVVRRPQLFLEVEATQLTARLAAAVAGEDPELVVPLMEGLAFDLLASDTPEEIERIFAVKLHRLESAIEHALRLWEEREPLAAR